MPILAGCDLFSGRSSSHELLTYRSQVCDRLVRGVAGDYYLLSSRIRDIRHVLSQGEMDRVLDRADDKQHNTAEYQLSNLAMRLSKQETIAT